METGDFEKPFWLNKVFDFLTEKSQLYGNQSRDI